MSGVDDVVRSMAFDLRLKEMSMMTKDQKRRRALQISAREEEYERRHADWNAWVDACRRFGVEAKRDGNWNFDQPDNGQFGYSMDGGDE